MFADQIKRFRAYKQLSQENLAAKSGLALRTIQNLEKGKCNPTLDTLTRVCRVLAMDPRLFIIPEMMLDSPFLSEMSALLADCSDDECEQLLQILHNIKDFAHTHQGSMAQPSQILPS